MVVRITTLAVSFPKLSVEILMPVRQVWYYHHSYRWGSKSLRLYLTHEDCGAYTYPSGCEACMWPDLMQLCSEDCRGSESNLSNPRQWLSYSISPSGIPSYVYFKCLNKSSLIYSISYCSQ